jgi:hypothetical protein
MAVPLGVGINFAQWTLTPTAFTVYDIARNNLSRLLNLSLTGLANALFADQAGTVDYGTTAYTEDAIRIAYEGAPNPGPTNTSWRRALETAMLLKGGSRFGNPILADARLEGRPVVISNAELAAL